MRHEKPENIIRLILMMQASAMGVSLKDIEGEFAVSRRTAERMRDSVLRLFPQAEEFYPLADRVKHWKIDRRTVNTLIAISKDELADMETAIKLLDGNGLSDPANNLRSLAIKLKASSQISMAGMEVDLEALAEAEGMAMRPGPRHNVDPETFATLRNAILACGKVRLHYRAQESGQVSRQIVCPYGFLYGNRRLL